MTAPTHSLDEVVHPPNPRTSRRLFQWGLTALLGSALLLIYRAENQDPLLLALGTIILTLGAFPALEWARKGLAHFPSFEMFMLTTIPFYAAPLLSGRRTDGLEFTAGAIWQAAIAMLVFQLGAIATFTATKGTGAKSPLLSATLLPQVAIRFAQTGLWLNSLYSYMVGFTDLIPYEYGTPIRAAFFGIGTVSLFIAARRWGAGQLFTVEKVVIALNILIQLVFLFRDLYLITGISLVLLGLIGYVSTSRRVPVLVIAVMLPLVAVLHSGKSTMRNFYWVEQRPLPTLTEVPAFFQAWFEAGLKPQSPDDTDAQSSLTGRLFDRASLFQMLCLVAERSPEFEPYLAGESYLSLPSQLVPSFLWPGKPSSLLSNILLAVHYRLVPADATTSVSIAFGMVAEAYANFGVLGCATLGVLLGYGYKRISVAALGCPQFSALGLLTILLAAWSFQVEQIMATWLISLIQASLVVIGVPLVFRILFHQE